MTKVRALVLERQHELALRDIDLPLETSPGEVKIRIHTVGVCGSDVHYYTHGKIGPFVVNAPMVLGHEAAGTVVEVGAGVTHLKVGDRVCMEPGIPDPNSKASLAWPVQYRPGRDLLGDPADPRRADARGRASRQLHLQATRQCQLCRRRHGRALRRRHAGGCQGEDHAGRHCRRPRRRADRHDGGDRGPCCKGCARAIVADLAQPKLDIAAQYQGVIPVNIREKNLVEEVGLLTDGWGADVVFECSGSPKAWETIMALPRPGGVIVVVGLPVNPIGFDVSTASTKEIRIETVFRYAHQYERSIALLGSGRVDLKPLISETFTFEDSIKAFDRAVEARPSDVKLQIVMG